MYIHKFVFAFSILLAFSACGNREETTGNFAVTRGMRGLAPEAQSVTVVNESGIDEPGGTGFVGPDENCLISAHSIVEVMSVLEDFDRHTEIRLFLSSNSASGPGRCPEGTEFVVDAATFRTMNEMHRSLLEAFKEMERISRETYGEQR